MDDGITGTTMKRPGFQKMIAAIEAGYISAVFVKDLSRLGRNYIEVGKLTEEFFPLHDVRLVAVSDGVDSNEGEDDFTPFKNIMNEYYAKDISKKRRIVNKMKGNSGIPLSPPASSRKQLFTPSAALRESRPPFLFSSKGNEALTMADHGGFRREPPGYSLTTDKF